MHTKLASVLAVLAIVTGSASAARAAAPPAPVPGVMHAARPAAMPGRGGMGAAEAAVSQRRLAHRRGPPKEADQRSLLGRVSPATVSGTMTQPTQPRRPDAPANPVTAYVVNQGGTVTPITTATNTAGTPIKTGSHPGAIAITPDGTTAYVATTRGATIAATAGPAGRRLRLPPGLAVPADVRVLLVFQNDRKVPPAFNCLP